MKKYYKDGHDEKDFGPPPPVKTLQQKAENESLKQEIERLKEIISYLPKVPTLPYEKELAIENAKLKDAYGVLREALEVCSKHTARVLMPDGTVYMKNVKTLESITANEALAKAEEGLK